MVELIRPYNNRADLWDRIHNGAGLWGRIHSASGNQRPNKFDPGLAGRARGKIFITAKKEPRRGGVPCLQQPDEIRQR